MSIASKSENLVEKNKELIDVEIQSVTLIKDLSKDTQEEVNEVVESIGKNNYQPIQNTPTERSVSALSLSSIRKRRELESSLEKKVINPDDLPRDVFTYDNLMIEWNKYSDRLTRSGIMIMSSLMGMVIPVLKGTTVSLEMPNEGSKISFDENKYDLANYLRKKLNNYDIEIEIIVNEEVRIEKKVLDNKDKLQRFIELNPAMQIFKDTFQLELK